MIYGLIALALIAVVALLARARAPVPIVIRKPTLGVLNLLGAAGSVIAAEDVRVLAPHFSDVRQNEGAPPPFCDVLVLYCEIDSSGAVKGSALRLRQIIRYARAMVVVVATEHPMENYIAAARRTGFGEANLVVTLARRGPAFANFLGGLFAQMKQGVPMPVAWNNLAPQIPMEEHKGLPETVFFCERGQVAFG